MCKILSLLIIFILISPSLLKAQDFFNPNKGLEPKTFGDISKGDSYVAKIRFDTKPFWQSKMSIQVIYNGVPDEFKGNPGSLAEGELVGDLVARFLDKDGFEIENNTLYMTTMCLVENQNLTCRDDVLIGADDYRKISKVVISKQ